MVGRCMDYYYVFAWREREVEGAWFSADLRHGVFSPAPVCKDSARESCLVCLPPTPPLPDRASERVS